MIEAVKIEKDSEYDFNKKVETKEEHVDKVINSVTLNRFVNTYKTVQCIEVTNIYNDEGDIIFETNYRGSHEIDGTNVRVPRDLMKKLIYDMYLK